VKVAVDAWTAPAGLVAGHVFRPVNRAGSVISDGLGEKVVWQMLRHYAGPSAFPELRPMTGAARREVSWTRFSCSSAIARSRRRV
jgi:hypothetical protein